MDKKIRRAAVQGLAPWKLFRPLQNFLFVVYEQKLIHPSLSEAVLSVMEKLLSSMQNFTFSLIYVVGNSNRCCCFLVPSRFCVFHLYSPMTFCEK